jgi:hypothetical protein
MQRPLRYFLAAATAALSLACAKSDHPVKTTSDEGVNTSPASSAEKAKGLSLVRIVNAVNGGRVISVELGEQPLFAAVKAEAVSDYKEVGVNLAKFAVRVQGGDASGMLLAEKDRVLMDGNRYTIFLVDDDSSKRSLQVVKDNVIADSGKARIRVFHAARIDRPLDVSIAGAKDKLFTNVKFKTADGFADVMPGPVTIEFRGTNETKVLLSIPRLDLKRGTATTIVVLGTRPLKYFTFTDAAMAPPATP